MSVVHQRNKMESDQNVLESVCKSSDQLDHTFESSDEYYDFLCSTCRKEGKNANAEMYCVECDHFLCETCLKHHNKFDSMKHHQVVKNASETEDGKVKRNSNWEDLPSQRCEIHHGKLIDMYCSDHNEVCCGTCACISHSSCSDLFYLPQKAKATDVMKETKDILEEIDQLEYRAKELSKEKQFEVANLKSEKATIIGQIKESCSKIINNLKAMETDLLTHLNDRVDTFEHDVQTEINITEQAVTHLNSQHLLLTKYSTAGDISSLFVQMKLAEKCCLKFKDTLNHLKASIKPVLEFSMNYRVSDAVNEIKSLGDITENKTIKSVSLNGDFDVKTSKEKSVCDITDIIMHDDGTLLITDFENKCLKRLDSQYRVAECLPLPGQPNAVCFVGSSSAAVAITDIKVVQFVNLTGRMALSSSFSVRNSCRGIAHKNGFIYVSCGGNHKYNEGKGFLSVYSYSGKRLKTFDMDVSLPKHILRHKDGHRMYVVDTQKCLLIMTTDGRLLERRIFRDIDNAMGICSGPGNQHFLSGFSSSTIILLTGNGYQMCTLNVDGIKKPQALCFDQNKSQLIVGMEKTNNIKVLDLKFK